MVAILTHDIATNNSRYIVVVNLIQSYEIKLPSQAFLDGRSSPLRRLSQVGVMTAPNEYEKKVLICCFSVFPVGIFTKIFKNSIPTNQKTVKLNLCPVKPKLFQTLIKDNLIGFS